MKKSRWWSLSAILIAAILVYCGLSNPTFSDYQREVLAPVVQAQSSASDAMLVSILQSIQLPGQPSQTSQPSPLTLLSDRTKRNNFILFSVYTTEHDFCPGNALSREWTATLGMAGRFYTLRRGGCQMEQPLQE